MEILRTPDARFAHLPDFPFAPHYLHTVDGLRMHYLDEGPPQGRVVLCLHGEPSWSFLYRKMIPILVAAGHRVVAPDLIGFGRSDKPAQRQAYTYQRHVDWTAEVLSQLDLREVTLVCQDWGGLIGLRLLADHPDRFARVVAANTGLPTGEQKPSEAFLAWRRFSQEAAELPIAALINGATKTELAPEVMAAYEAPFPDERYKAGARQFPALVPITPDDPAAEANRRAWAALSRWEKPFLTAFSDGDPITRGGERAFQERVPGARDQLHTTMVGAGHFLQEDCGEQLADVVVDFMAR